MTTHTNNPTADDDLEDMRIDLRFVGIEYELWALGRMLHEIEPTIKRLASQDKRKTLKELEEGGWSHDEAETSLAFQDIHEMQTYVLPRFLRAPFVVSLWSTYESGVQSIATELRTYLHSPNLRLSQLRGDFFERGRRYFDAVLGLPLEDASDLLTRLRDLYQVRNAIVHANGLKEAMPDEEWTRLGEVVLRHGMELSAGRGMLIPAESYLSEAYRDVGASLRGLVERARVRADAQHE